MRTENKEFAKRSMQCETLVKKRHKNYDYIERAFCESVFWMNAVKMTGDEILAMQEQSTLYSQTEQFFLISLSIAKLLDMGNLSNYIKALQQLFEEFQIYYYGGAKLNTIILNTQSFTLQPIRKQAKVAKEIRLKQKEILRNLSSNNGIKGDEDFIDATIGVFFPEEPDAPIEYKDFKMLHGSIGPRNEDTRSPQIRLKKVTSKNPDFHVLAVMNVPADLNFKDVVYTLCETMKLVYNKFFDIQSIDDGVLRQIFKMDQVMKKLILKPLCDIIGTAAARTIKQEIDSLFRN